MLNDAPRQIGAEERRVWNRFRQPKGLFIDFAKAIKRLGLMFEVAATTTGAAVCGGGGYGSMDAGGGELPKRAKAITVWARSQTECESVCVRVCVWCGMGNNLNTLPLSLRASPRLLANSIYLNCRCNALYALW